MSLLTQLSAIIPDIKIGSFKNLIWVECDGAILRFNTRAYQEAIITSCPAGSDPEACLLKELTNLGADYILSKGTYHPLYLKPSLFLFQIPHKGFFYTQAQNPQAAISKIQLLYPTDTIITHDNLPWKKWHQPTSLSFPWNFHITQSLTFITTHLSLHNSADHYCGYHAWFHQWYLQTFGSHKPTLSTNHAGDSFQNILNHLKGTPWTESGEYGNNFRTLISQLQSLPPPKETLTYIP
jgi:hypothetical protein